METLLSPTKLFIRTAHEYAEKGAGLCRYGQCSFAGPSRRWGCSTFENVNSIIYWDRREHLSMCIVILNEEAVREGIFKNDAHNWRFCSSWAFSWYVVRNTNSNNNNKESDIYYRMNYLSPLHAFQKILPQPCEISLLCKPTYRGGNWGPEKLRKLLKVTHPVGDRLGLAVLLSDVCSDHYPLWVH